MAKKPGVYSTGDWDKAKRLFAGLDSALQEQVEVLLKQIGLKSEQLAVLRIDDQPADWPALSAMYLAEKIEEGYSDKIYVRTDTLRQNITSRVKGGVVFAGVLREAKSEDGESLENVAVTMEFGSLSRNIPARPLFGPTLEDLVDWLRERQFITEEDFRRIRGRLKI